MKTIVIMNKDGEIHKMNQKEMQQYKDYLIERQKNELWEKIKRKIGKEINAGE